MTHHSGQSPVNVEEIGISHVLAVAKPELCEYLEKEKKSRGK